MIEVKESHIQNQILQYLSFKGIYCWRNNSVGVFDPIRKIYRKAKNGYLINGVSDILGIIPPQISRSKAPIFIAIEVKSRKGKLSESQKIFIENINKNGGVGLVLRSIDEAIEELKKYILT